MLRGHPCSLCLLTSAELCLISFFPPLAPHSRVSSTASKATISINAHRVNNKNMPHTSSQAQTLSFPSKMPFSLFVFVLYGWTCTECGWTTRQHKSPVEVDSNRSTQEGRNKISRRQTFESITQNQQTRQKSSSMAYRHSCRPNLAAVWLVLAIWMTMHSSPFISSIVVASSSPSSLDPGEILVEGVELLPLESGPSMRTVALCDSAQSRKARQIVKELFLSQLPTNFQVPLTCPFHPYLDLLAHEDRSKSRVTGSGSSSSSGHWKCTTCQRTFKDQFSIDQHIQNRHMHHVTSNMICLSDYCDILDCDHRMVSFDPLTGDRLKVGQEGGLYGSARSRARRERKARREAAAAAGGGYEESIADTSNDDGIEQRVPASPYHPHSNRCHPHAMELARSKCQKVLLDCLPFRGTHAYGLPSSEVHQLYDRFSREICQPFQCTLEGTFLNIETLQRIRWEISRQRLFGIFFALAMFGICVFYFLIFSLRTEFGYRTNTTGMTTSLLASDRSASSSSSWKNRLRRWFGMEKKKRTMMSKIM